MKFFSLIIFIQLMICNMARAEGNCPEGQFPIGDTSAQGCAPIPGYESTNSKQQTTRFETRWGAIATDDTKGILGVSKNSKSKRSANKAALQQCKSNGGGKNCEMTLTYFNQCAALAWGDSSRGAAGRAGSEAAKKAALEVCNKRTTNCKVVYTDCSLPERVQ